jgi:hypothetical protein
MRQRRQNLLADLPEERQQRILRNPWPDCPGSAPSTKVVSDCRLHATAAKGSRSCAATPSSKLVKFLRRHVKRPLPYDQDLAPLAISPAPVRKGPTGQAKIQRLAGFTRSLMLDPCLAECRAKRIRPA